MLEQYPDVDEGVEQTAENIFSELPEGSQETFERAYNLRGDYWVTVIPEEVSWGGIEEFVAEEYGEEPPFFSVFETLDDDGKITGALVIGHTEPLSTCPN